MDKASVPVRKAVTQRGRMCNAIHLLSFVT